MYKHTTLQALASVAVVVPGDGVCEVLHEAERGCIGAVGARNAFGAAVVCVQANGVSSRGVLLLLHAAVYRRLRLRSSKKKNSVYIRMGKIMFF